MVTEDSRSPEKPLVTTLKEAGEVKRIECWLGEGIRRAGDTVGAGPRGNAWLLYGGEMACHGNPTSPMSAGGKVRSNAFSVIFNVVDD